MIYYFIYLAGSAALTILVGWLFYLNGELYLQRLLKDDSMARIVNKLLLTGYYLLNIGFIVTTLVRDSGYSSDLDQLAYALSRIGFIALLLGGIHFFNLAVIFQISRRMSQGMNESI